MYISFFSKYLLFVMTWKCSPSLFQTCFIMKDKFLVQSRADLCKNISVVEWHAYFSD